MIGSRFSSHVGRPAPKPPEVRVVPADRWRNLKTALGIMGVGMLVAVIWSAFQGWVFHKSYPYNTFLYLPGARFSDFTDALLFSSRPNPYEDPYAVYLPFALICLRTFVGVNASIAVILFLFASLGGLYLVLFKALSQVVRHPWLRAFLCLLFLGLSYPILFCIDRGNIEIFLILLVTGALYFFGRNKHGLGMLFLVPAISFKLYPAILLVLVFRQRKIKLLLYGLASCVALTYASLILLPLSIDTAWRFLSHDMAFFNRTYVDENYSLEGSSTLWNTYKIAVISAGKLGLMPPVEFSFDGRFVTTSQAVYSGLMALLAIVLVLYVCLWEKEFLRCAVVLLLFMTTATPAGSDYRLLYANAALVLLVLLKTRRPHDFATLILLAMTMIPKKEIILTYAGITDSNVCDVTLQVVLNPLFLLSALILLLHDSMVFYDARWSGLRLRRLLRAR